MAKLTLKKLDQLEEDIQFFNSNVLRVGMVSNPHLTSEGEDSEALKRGVDGKTSPKTMAEILAIHEEGRDPMPDSPARAPISITMRDRQDDINRDLQDFLGAMMKGKSTAEIVLAGVGETIVQLIRETVVAGLPPKLTDARKKEKRRHGKPADTPLIFGGQLQGSWRYAIIRELRV